MWRKGEKSALFFRRKLSSRYCVLANARKVFRGVEMLKYFNLFDQNLMLHERKSRFEFRGLDR